MGEGLTFSPEAMLLVQIIAHSDTAPRTWDLVCDRLNSDDFTTAPNSAIYSGLAELAEDGEPITHWVEA